MKEFVCLDMDVIEAMLGCCKEKANSCNTIGLCCLISVMIVWVTVDLGQLVARPASRVAAAATRNKIYLSSQASL